jgi:hypothetical protein
MENRRLAVVVAAATFGRRCDERPCRNLRGSESAVPGSLVAGVETSTGMTGVDSSMRSLFISAVLLAATTSHAAELKCDIRQKFLCEES